jgi:phage terminase large subunit
MQHTFRLNQGQLEFLNSKKREAAITSGLGGGKSFVLRLGLLVDALRYPGCMHCYASLSYQNMMDSAIPNFKNLLDSIGIVYKESKSQHSILVGPNETPCLFRSQETHTNMRSVEFGSLRCDELAYWEREAYLVFLGRLRDTKGPMHMRAATTPNGLNFFYELFKKDIEEKNKGYEKREMIRTSTRDNKHLPEDYIDLLESSYDTQMLEQELKGGFFASGTRTYYNFTRENNVRKCEFDPSLPVVIGMDFNVNPMTAVVMQHHGDNTHVFKEFWIENSNTEAMIDMIKNYFGGSDGITIIPDSTGDNRKTNSSKTDLALLREAGFNVPRSSQSSKERPIQ